MFGVLVVSHGNLASELRSAAETVAGRSIPIEALNLDWGLPPAEVRARLAARIHELDRGEGVLVLTPLHGDTPTNAAVSLSRSGRVEVVTGVNLPMLLRIGCQNLTNVALSEAASLLEQKGRQGVGRATATASGSPAEGCR